MSGWLPRALILSRPGSGFYVANQAAPFALSEVGPRLDREIDPFWVSRQSLEAGDIGLKPVAAGCRRPGFRRMAFAAPWRRWRESTDRCCLPG